MKFALVIQVPRIYFHTEGGLRWQKWTQYLWSKKPAKTVRRKRDQNRRALSSSINLDAGNLTKIPDIQYRVTKNIYCFA